MVRECLKLFRYEDGMRRRRTVLLSLSRKHKQAKLWFHAGMYNACDIWRPSHTISDRNVVSYSKDAIVSDEVRVYVDIRRSSPYHENDDPSARDVTSAYFL